MDLHAELQHHYQNLDSGKIYTRRRSAEHLRNLIIQKPVINALNTGAFNISWDDLVSAYHRFLLKEAQRYDSAERNVGEKIYLSTQNYGTCFIKIVEIANITEKHLSLSNLLEFVFDSFSIEYLKKYYMGIYVDILQLHVLSVEEYCGEISPTMWKTLLNFVKDLIINPVQTVGKLKPLNCLHLIIQCGSLHGLFYDELQQNFDFITQVGLNIKTTSPRVEQELIINLVISFCKRTKQNNRISCCKLGEALFNSYLEICNNQMLVNIKLLVLEFFLIQIQLHHPNGATEGTDSAYAFSWVEWQKMLRSLYAVLHTDIGNDRQLKVNSNVSGVHIIDSTLSALFVEICIQVFDIPTFISQTQTDGVPNKRQRVEVGLCTLINNIRNFQSWTWLNIMGDLLNKYPTVILLNEFVTLLKILSALQSEYKSIGVRYHLYECLSVLVDVEKHLITTGYVETINSLWTIVWSNTLRAVGLNEIEQKTHKLLQKLMPKQDELNILQLYKTYYSQVIKLGKYSLETLYTACSTFGLNDATNKENKENLINWILKREDKIVNTGVFRELVTAQVLVFLSFKEWPTDTNINDKDNDQSVAEGLILSVAKTNETEEQTYHKIVRINLNIFEYFIKDLHDFVLTALQINITNLSETADLLNIIILLVNVLSIMIDYGLLKLFEIEDHIFVNDLKAMWDKFENSVLSLSQSLSKKVISSLITVTTLIQKLLDLKLHKSVMLIVKKNISIDFIKHFFKIINETPEERNDENFNEQRKEESFKKLSTVTISMICSYCCITNAEGAFETQACVLEVLVEPTFNPSLPRDCLQLSTFLKSLKGYKIGTLTDIMLQQILQSIQKLCDVHYKKYEIALGVVNVMCDLYPHFASVNEEGLRENSLIILNVFYQYHKNYGPKVAVAILKCVQQLVRIDPTISWSLWPTGEQIPLSVPSFLINDYHEVRVKAIETLGTIFQLLSKNKQQVKLLRMIFQETFVESRSVFTIFTETYNEEHRLDKTKMLSYSVLHTFATIMAMNSGFRQSALFEYILIVYQVKLDISLSRNILEMVARHLALPNATTFVELNLTYLLSQWQERGLSIKDFPYYLLNYSFEEFCSNYQRLLVPILIAMDPQDFRSNCPYSTDILSSLVKECFPKIVARICLSKAIEQKNAVEIKFLHNCMENLGNILSEALDTLLLNSFEEIIGFMLEYCFDPHDFYNKFTIDCELPEPELPYFSCDIILIPYLNCEEAFSVYLLRTVSYLMVYLIVEDHGDDSFLNIICCQYFASFIRKILPENAKTFKNFLVTFISILIPVAKTDGVLGEECTKVLHLIVVVYGKNLSEAIKSLDPFPGDSQFNEMQEVYNNLKYEERLFSLEDEIKHFLNTGNLIGTSGLRTEGLKHLKIQLTTRKEELKDMYSKLYDLRGLPEDYKTSLLHNLICMLVKLSKSLDLHESIEATRCLGELGTADLLTTVLQIEETYQQETLKPFELVTGNVVALLTKYIVHNKIEVIEAASKALYYVLHCKESKIVLDSGIDYGQGVTNKNYLTPFIPLVIFRTDTNYNIEQDAINLINSDELWCPPLPKSHEEWITDLTCTLLSKFVNKCYLKELIPLCKIEISFTEQLLPLLVYLIICGGYTNVISNQLQRFFKKHWKHSSDDSSTIEVNKASVQCLLNVVHFLRVRRNVETNKKIYDLVLNYLHIAEAALFCKAHFTSVLYVELWCQKKIEELWQEKNNFLELSMKSTSLDLIIQREDLRTQKTLQNILTESYKIVGELDALRVCEIIGMIDETLQVERYKHSQQWELVALYHDVQVSCGNANSVPHLLSALKKCSFYHLPLRYENNVEPQFECLWRLSQWNVEESAAGNSSNTFEKHQYFTLRALHDNDSFSFNKFLKSARIFTLDCLRNSNFESSKNLYKPLMQLQSLQEVEDFVKAKSERSFQDVLKKWNIQDEINRNDFEFIEPIQAQRIIMLTDTIQEESKDLKIILANMYLKLAEISRQENKLNVANRALNNLLQLADLGVEIENKITLEQAQLCWLNDKQIARYILRTFLNTPRNPRLESRALKLYGTWMAETSSENPERIIKDYFLKSLNILNEVAKTKEDYVNMCETYAVLAKFADSQYQQVINYIKSSVFKSKITNMEKSKQVAADIKKHSSSKAATDIRRAITTYEKQSVIDESEIKSTYKEKDVHLLLAVKFYMRNLRYSDQNNKYIFRILALLLENRDNSLLLSLFSNNYTRIPSYKYIDILPQVVPHITTNTKNIFGNLIYGIIEHCARDHPHHTLPFILAVANSNKDKDYTSEMANVVSNDSRVTGAQKAIKKLKKTSLHDLISKMEKLSEALMQLAYLEQSNCQVSKKNQFKIPTNCAITKIKNFEDVLLPTFNLKVKTNADYTNIVGIKSFSKTFDNVGGINAPKRIVCLGTDGVYRNQLIKGKDDLRQDAVMQQVFSIMNDLLRANKHTSKLLIRTYKILPLSQRSGILEWVENTVPLGTYLVGEERKSGAHQLYNPSDITPAECRKELRNIVNASHADKLKVYDNICKRFHPVFHKFFEESFVQPVIWYERRRAYIYSVATSSICGYILGLGDRHVNNILLDTRTAEVVHIDFGIAFEQGKILPTPETVPFRLTRDMEAGMGVLGVEGVFRKSCENTLEVLRKNSDTVITILEVLLYDPLYAWTITPAQAFTFQYRDDDGCATRANQSADSIEEEGVNMTAERALLRLRQKLEGIADGGMTNIEGQVEKLLQQARDPSNLCRLFHGWQPYL